jgi:tellurite resistance protein TehA-like permease
MFYLLPVSYLMILLSVEQTGQDLLAPVVSLVCCYFGIQAIRLVFSDTISVSLKPQDWKLMVLGGVAASIFNALGLALLDHGQDSVAPNSTRFFEVLGYVTGDVLGLVICLLFMVYFFRMVRHFKPMSDD